ncbi:MAG TPA: UDP-N-acetylmuramoyl-L-alanyl-D-glutamate--2,6-diaminopimelate ligase [Bacteroidota bacterium]|jgi:UDP-N-acetylmuramoyl-L-alanyl-D-glutamate--2,6-diaminopimelate ligase
MDLSQVIEGMPITKIFQTMFGKMVVTHEVKVAGIQYDSRKVGRDDLFVAIRGLVADGHRFIINAVSNGAKTIILEDDSAIPDSYFMHTEVVKIVVRDARKALAIAAANFYNKPAAGLNIIGITGTNGKTTTTHLVKSILEAQGEKVGLIGTIAYLAGNETIPATHTTPESLELHQLFGTMRQKACTSVVMEVSSHSLAMQRVFGVDFRAGVFTNLTQDHLDFHGTMEEYFTAKKSLFTSLDSRSIAVTNLDDPYGRTIVEGAAGNIVTYSLDKAASVQGKNIRLRFDKTSVQIGHDGISHDLTTSLIGRFNVQNVLAAYATGVGLGIPDATIVKGIESTRPVQGRFEQIASPRGWTAIIDYAHTPDALDNCLRAINDIRPAKGSGRIITIFGCGGDRDKAKRPLMGRIASAASDVTIVTSDNPRTENPDRIINDITAGIETKTNLHVESDRRKAIKHALTLASDGDIVLIAGKGHEDYQVVGTEKHHLDDREEVESFIEGLA